MTLPAEFPTGLTFGLVVLSEVGYYWNASDLAQATNQLLAALRPGLFLLRYQAPQL